jgi:PAS domain S-box-containing protein
VFDDAHGTMRCSHEWVAGGLASIEGIEIDGSSAGDRWWMQHMRRIDPIRLANVADEIPPQAGSARAWLLDRGMRALIAVPIVQHGSVRGAVTCTSHGPLRSIGDDAVSLLRIVGELCLGALSHARSQHALVASEARKAAILQSALDCIVSMDAQGLVTEFNPAAEAAFGWSRDEAMGRDLAELMIPMAMREAHAAGLRHFLSGSDSSVIGRRIEVSAMRRDGREFPVELAVVATTIDGETIFTAYLRDITQRREMERLRDELVATVSHELRTPLTSLRGFTELLLKRDFPLERKRKFLAVIHNETIRLTKLVNDFLDLKRLESGAEKLRTERFDVATLLDDTVTLFRRDDLPHVFELEIGEDLTLVRGDPDRTRQILANLVSNAVKFAPDGGRVTIGARLEGAFVLVSVRDHGIGMSEQTIEKLFRKFFRADNAETRSIGGTGLGLALVKEMVEQQGGRVSVTSAPGTGSTFSFTLPAANATPNEKPNEDPEDLSYAQPVSQR